MQPRPHKGKDPERCDASDSRPVAAFLEYQEQPGLSVDERIRNAIRQLLPDITAGESPTESDLRILEQIDDDEMAFTPHEERAMVDEFVPNDVDNFIASLSAEDIARVREVLEPESPEQDADNDEQTIPKKEVVE